jgi:hypothetical protein
MSKRKLCKPARPAIAPEPNSVRTLDHINTPEYQNLVAEYEEAYRPATREERFHVKVLVQSEWLQRQCALAEDAILDRHRIAGGTEEENSSIALYLRAADDLEQLDVVFSSAVRHYGASFHYLESLQLAKAA